MGADFNNSSTVRWNGQDRQTIFVTPNQLTVIIPASDLAAAGTANVTVFNPATGGGSSNALPFTIKPAPNAAPSLTSLSPSLVNAGSPGFSLIVTGTGFNVNSQVRWNGLALPTAFISATQLTAMVSANDTAAAGQSSVTVFNSAPGDGISNALSLSIAPTPSPVPTLNNLSPDSVTAGGPGLSLTVTGAGFTPDSVVRWNGNDRPTLYLSPYQLVASISAADIAAAGTASVSVFTNSSGGKVTNSLPFTITNVPPPAPKLFSISVREVAQGARHVSLILVGANFRPGARVVISQTFQSGDVAVESVTQISDTTILAQINVSDRATPKIHLVDVVNADNSSTGPQGSRTSQSLRVELATSLAAPLAIRSLIITNPRDGALVAQGDEVYPEAILGGVGTGTITGQWLWDGNVTEQFVASFTGGQSATVQAMTALPTVFLGLHTLELRITSPNTLVSNAIKVIVNPGSWKQMHLIAPDSGSGYAPENPPLLRWSIVAGAVGYQVGFATQPFFGKVSHWYDVADTQWQVPEKIWTRLPSGELYWTVRAVELGKQTSHPAAMRRLWRVSNGALMAVPKQPTPPAAGVTLLQWLRLSAHAVYRVTLFGDPDGKQVVRRALTTESLITFRDTRG
jgi:hypothetical protein